MAKSTLEFIEEVGLGDEDPQTHIRKVRTANFSFSRSTDSDSPDKLKSENVEMNIPLLAIVNIPALSIDKVSITFDMEVKSSVSSQTKTDKSASADANAALKIGPFRMNVQIKGSVACHESNTRSSDNSAKYHVEVQASQQKTPEGLMRMLDILSSAVSPSAVSPQTDKKPAAGG